MASLTISQIQTIQKHMTYDESTLTKQFKATIRHTVYFAK